MSLKSTALGRDGAQAVAGSLAARLKKAVRWALMPSNAKDVRAWLGSHDINVRDETAIRATGSNLLAAITGALIEVTPRPDVASGE